MWSQRLEPQFGNQRSPPPLHFRFIILSLGRHSDCTITKSCRSLTSHHVKNQGGLESKSTGRCDRRDVSGFLHLYTGSHYFLFEMVVFFDHHRFGHFKFPLCIHTVYFSKKKCIASHIPLLLFALKANCFLIFKKCFSQQKIIWHDI